ncbi:MAG: hemolysin family protein [Candidatus Latescibacterota bacterium]|nr:hemolysin family protein [Candidatus Latescibacterota bacterium]
MEPPQLALWISIAVGSALALFALASYEATFASLSRSSLERFSENGVRRADAMLRIFAPRHRLQVMTRIGLGLLAVCLAIALGQLFDSLPGALLPVLLTVIVGGVVLLSTGLAGRLRFEAEGEEPRISPLALSFIPLYYTLIPCALLVERLSSAGDYTDEEFKAEKEEELRSLVESEGESGVLEEGERDMIEGVFGFHERVVREVMVPRVDITAVEQDATVGDLIRTIRETGHSRVPIYEESLDTVRGIAYAKDLLLVLELEDHDISVDTPLRDLVNAPEGSPIRMLREPYYVPETKTIDQLLRDLRSARTRLASVVDEYGGTGGLVTTEDLVEEIVGELQDEYDAEEDLYHWQKQDDILVVNPRINMDELNELLESDLPNDGFDTLGGYIYDHVGHVPEPGQAIDAPGFSITILTVEGQRIGRVKMERIQTDPETAISNPEGP